MTNHVDLVARLRAAAKEAGGADERLLTEAAEALTPPPVKPESLDAWKQRVMAFVEPYCKSQAREHLRALLDDVDARLLSVRFAEIDVLDKILAERPPPDSCALGVQFVRRVLTNRLNWLGAQILAAAGEDSR